jgi:protein TonB
MPSFPWWAEAMYKYIYETIKYPKEDREQGKEGMVIINFIVEPDGSITNAKVLRGVSPA